MHIFKVADLEKKLKDVQAEKLAADKKYDFQLTQVADTLAR